MSYTISNVSFDLNTNTISMDVQGYSGTKCEICGRTDCVCDQIDWEAGGTSLLPEENHLDPEESYVGTCPTCGVWTSPNVSCGCQQPDCPECSPHTWDGEPVIANQIHAG